MLKFINDSSLNINLIINFFYNFILININNYLFFEIVLTKF